MLLGHLELLEGLALHVGVACEVASGLLPLNEPLDPIHLPPAPVTSGAGEVVDTEVDPGPT